MSNIVNWQVFEYKFKDNQPGKFEKLTFDIFNRMLGDEKEISDLYRRRGIDPVVFESQGKRIGFQAKYYNSSTVTAQQTYQMTSTLKLWSDKFAVDVLYFFINRPFAKNPMTGDSNTKAFLQLMQVTVELGIEVNWMTPNKIDAILQTSEMTDLYDYYFTMEEVCKPEFWRKTDTLYKYMELAHLESAIVNGVYASKLGISNPFEKEGVKNPDLYRKCSMTNSPKQMLLWAYYGRHRGCCVEFDVSGIDRTFLRKVEYTTEYLPHSYMSPKEVCNDLYRAGKEWEHENEYRAVYYERDCDKDIWKILDHDIYLKATVKSVTFGLYASEDKLYGQSLELLQKYKITGAKCQLRSDKYELTEDPQFDIEAEIDSMKEREGDTKHKEDIRVNITNIYGTIQGDFVARDKYVNNGPSPEDTERILTCISANSISKEDIAEVVSVLRDINASQNDLTTEYAYMASVTRDGGKSGFVKKLKEKVDFSNGVLNLTKTIGEICVKHPEWVQGIIGLLGTV